MKMPKSYRHSALRRGICLVFSTILNRSFCLASCQDRADSASGCGMTVAFLGFLGGGKPATAEVVGTGEDFQNGFTILIHRHPSHSLRSNTIVQSL